MRGVVLALLLAACAAPARVGSAAEEMAPLLGCWRGTFAEGPAEIRDERCFETLGEHVVDRHIVVPVNYSGETTYHVGGGGDRIIFAYAASDGGRSHGEVQRTPQGYNFPDHEYRAGNGTLRRLRARWVFEGPDRFVSVSEHDEGQGWRPLMRITYERVRGIE